MSKRKREEAVFATSIRAIASNNATYSKLPDSIIKAEGGSNFFSWGKRWHSIGKMD